MFPTLVRKNIIFSPPDKTDLAYIPMKMFNGIVTRNRFGINTINSFCHHCSSIIVIVLAVVTITNFDIFYLADNRMEKWLA